MAPLPAAVQERYFVFLHELPNRDKTLFKFYSPEQDDNTRPFHMGVPPPPPSPPGRSEWKVQFHLSFCFTCTSTTTPKKFHPGNFKKEQNLQQKFPTGKCSRKNTLNTPKRPQVKFSHIRNQLQKREHKITVPNACQTPNFNHTIHYCTTIAR